MNDPTGAVTPEAKLRNPGTIELHARDFDLDDRGARMAIYARLPDGRCWDEEHLALCMNVNELWAPFTVIRKLLIEAGRRNVGTGILMTPDERSRWLEYLNTLAGANGDEAMHKAQQEGSGIRPFRLRDL